MKEINAIHTPCKNCIFATYENNTQTGCELDYIDLFRNNNIEVLEAYDEEREFYIINNKKCIAYRTDKWLEDNNLLNCSINEKIQYFQKTNFIHYTAIINLSSISSIDDLLFLCEKLSSSDYPPRNIIFVRYRDTSGKLFSFNVLESVIKESKLSCKWRIQSMVDESLSYRDVLHNSIIFHMIKDRFVLSIESMVSDLALISHANQKVYKNMEQFIIMSNKDKTLVLFSPSIYRYAYKTTDENILLNEKHYIYV